MGLPDSNKGGARGHVLISIPYGGLYKGLDREFHPCRSLQIPSRIRYNFLCVSFVAYWL